MSQHGQHRNPDEIEAEVYQARAQLDDTLHEIRHRLSPAQVRELTHNLVHNGSGGATELFRNLGQTIRQNPVPFLVTGVGLGWLIMSQRKARTFDRHDEEIPATSEAPQRMTATHLGTQQGRAQVSQHRPDVVGEATHLGTGQGWSGYVHPSI